MSVVEVVIPASQQLFLIHFNQFPNCVDFVPSKTTATMKPNRNEPVLRSSMFTFNVYVRWLIAISGIEEKAIRSAAE